MQIFRGGIFWVLFVVFVAGNLPAADWFVDNYRGDDANSGTREKPFRSLEAGCKALRGGDALHLIPNIEPYQGTFRILKDKSGTAQRPTVIDGHGAKLNRLTHYGMEQWKEEGNGVFSMKFRNNCVSMSHQGYWGGFRFVFCDGKLIDWVKTREELRPETYLLVLRWHPETQKHDPLHNTLFVRLPAGKTPADVRIEAPGYDACAVDGADYVTVRNLEVEWCSADAFDTAWGKGIVFENVRSSYCMDQGISNHSANGAVVRNCRFAQAIDGGILDINMRKGATCKVRYVDCLIDANFHLGGAGFHDGEYEMENCLIRDNDGCGVWLRRGGNADEKTPRVRLVNCRIVRGIGNAQTGVVVGENCRLEMEGCTVEGFPAGVRVAKDGSAVLKNNLFLGCQSAIIGVELSAGSLSSDGNKFSAGTAFEYNKKIAKSLAEWTALSGQDTGSQELSPASIEAGGK